MIKKKSIALLSGAMLFFSVLAAGCSGQKEANVNQDAGQEESSREAESKESDNSDESGKLRSFEAKTLDGQKFTGEDIAKRDVTLINFWSVYCGPCIDEMPEIAELEKSLPDNVQIITVCLDGEAEPDFAEQIVKKAGYEGITLIGGDGDLKKINDGIRYTPTTIVVDKDGNIIGEEIIGGQENLEEEFTEVINQALSTMGKEAMSAGGK